MDKIINDIVENATRASNRRRQVISDPFAKLGLYVENPTDHDEKLENDIIPQVPNASRPYSPHDSRFYVGEHGNAFRKTNNNISPYLYKNIKRGEDDNNRAIDSERESVNLLKPSPKIFSIKGSTATNS